MVQIPLRNGGPGVYSGDNILPKSLCWEKYICLGGGKSIVGTAVYCGTVSTSIIFKLIWLGVYYLL